MPLRRSWFEPVAAVATFGIALVLFATTSRFLAKPVIPPTTALARSLSHPLTVKGEIPTDPEVGEKIRSSGGRVNGYGTEWIVRDKPGSPDRGPAALDPPLLRPERRLGATTAPDVKFAASVELTRPQ